MNQRNITLIRQLLAKLWNDTVTQQVGPYSDSNFHKVLREGVRTDRINQHFSGANTISNNSMNEYIVGIEALGAYHDNDPIHAYYDRCSSDIEGRKRLKVLLFGSSGERKSGRAREGTEREQEFEWLNPSTDEVAE